MNVRNRLQTSRSTFYRSFLLPLSSAALIGAFVAACGGGNGGGVAPPPPPPPPPPSLIEGKFTNNVVEGLGFRVDGVDDGATGEDGLFGYLDSVPVEFFVGNSTDHIAIGGVTLSAPESGIVQITERDLFEVTGDACSDNFVGNVARLLQTLDADQTYRNGLLIDATGIAAITDSIDGRVELDYCVSADDFAADPTVVAVTAALGRDLLPFDVAFANFTTNFKPRRSSTIALTSDDRRVVVPNRQKNTVSVIEVVAEDGSDSDAIVAEIDIGNEPRFVAITPDDRFALVTSAVSGQVDVIDLTAATPEKANTIDVGVEPRAIVISPNGRYAFVANHTLGFVTILSAANDFAVLGTVETGGNPQSIAITNDGDDDDRDERVFVTRLFAELIDPGRPDGFDDAKQGVVDSFSLGAAVDGEALVEQFALAPMQSGFAADRRQFCLETRRVLDANGDFVFFNSGPDEAGAGEEALAHDTFCPDIQSADASVDGALANTPQQVYPNMLNAALIRGPLLYVPNVGAQPEPPVKFNTNVQGLVSTLSFAAGGGSELSVNLNNQIKTETQPDNPTESLDRLFMNDIVAIDADELGNEFLIVSRGGNLVIRAGVDDEEKLSINAPDSVVRLQTGNLPTGIVANSSGTRAYTNNELSTSVTAIDLANNAVIELDIESSPPPAPGTIEHRRLLGKLAFFTALGIPDDLDSDNDFQFDVPIRDIIPLEHRGKASDNGWSSCASCHEDGHSDNVTWIFPTGPRQTIPLEGTFARFDLNDQRILNWNAVRGSVTDFNNNARGVQGGEGFATDVDGVGTDRTSDVFNHGPTGGISDALDALTEWVATVRSPIMEAPDGPLGDFADELQLSRSGFTQNCASCHGGVKWTKSRTAPLYANNPTFAEDPIGSGFFSGVPVLDEKLVTAGPQIVGVTSVADADLDADGSLRLLDVVGTFDPQSPLELRGAGGIAGQSTQGFAALTALGPFSANGSNLFHAPGAFNAPSLLGLAYSAPYLHDGSAATLEDVFARHHIADLDGEQRPIDEVLSTLQKESLKSLLLRIDDDTQTVNSDTDGFLQ